MTQIMTQTDDTNVRDPLPAGLAMLGAAIHRISKFRQSHYDEFLDNGFESLKDKEPSVRSLYGDDYIQDIRSCSRSKKATETAFSSSTKVKHNLKSISTHKDHIWRAKWLKNTYKRARDTCLEFGYLFGVRYTCLEFNILVWSLKYFFEFERISIEFVILFLRSSYL